MTFCFFGSVIAQFQSLESENLRLLYYDTAHAPVIPHLRRCFENSMKFYRNLFHYAPSEKVTVFLQDFDDYGYAGATALPFNYLILGIEPYEQVYETSPTNERLNWVMSHELMHIVSTDKANRADNLYRSIFSGKVSPVQQQPLSMLYSYYTTPRKYSPRWYLEGVAVFMETWLAGGIGRAQGGYDEMVFRTMVADSSYFYDVVGLESEGTTVDFQIGQNSYLYGTRFMSYLAFQYGPEKILAWIDRPEESDKDFASQFERVFSRPLDDAWSAWVDWERIFQRANLDSIRQHPLTSLRPLSSNPLGAVSRSYYDRSAGKLYAAVNYPGQLAHIVSIDVAGGNVENICPIHSPALYYVCATAFDPDRRLMFYTTNNNKSWRNLNVVDLRTGETSMLLKNCRIGDLAFNRADSSIWGIQHNNGLSSIVRIPSPYAGWNELVRLPYGRDLFDIDISPDGQYLVGSLMEISGRQKLVRLSVNSLMMGESAFDSLYEFDKNEPLNFVYSPDGKYIYGTTYFTGVSNIVRYDVAAKKMEWLTNTETGLFRPICLSDDSLIAYRYTGKGFLPVVLPGRPIEDVSAISYLGYQISEKYPVVRSWILPSPLTVSIDSLTSDKGEYNGFGGIKLRSLYPIAEGYKDLAAYGLRMSLTDPLFENDLDLTASYTPNRFLPVDERLHASLNYRRWEWKLSATYNRADFYDLFGPTKTSGKGYSLGLQYSHTIINENPKNLEYTAKLTGWGGLERLPGYQNVTASFDQYLTGEVQISYRNLHRSLGAVESEQGARSQITLSNNTVNGYNFPRAYVTADYGILLPIDHSSLWLRSSGGYSHGDRDEPFANFFFGGYGNNWVDYQIAKRFREFYTFPGAAIDNIAGTNFAKLLLEWTLPPIRFRRFGVMNLYCTWASVSLFSSALVTNFDSRADRQTFVNAGGQVDMKIIIFSRLETTLSFGYAVAAEKRQRRAGESMVSLKIM
jgi:hypothetical protein